MCITLRNSPHARLAQSEASPHYPAQPEPEQQRDGGVGGRFQDAAQNRRPSFAPVARSAGKVSQIRGRPPRARQPPQFQPSFLRPLLRFSAAVSFSFVLVMRSLIARRTRTATLLASSLAMARVLRVLTALGATFRIAAA